MKVLVLGSGGREHALAWRLAQCPTVSELAAVPGNPGMAALGACFDASLADFDRLVEIVRREGVDLTVVGPEVPLCAGVVDHFKKRDLKIFGPTRAAAQLEGSKSFAKGLMVKAGIPTAPFRTVDSMEAGESWLSGDVSYPVVIKASGLAGGKGVVIARTADEALEALRVFLVDRTFGDASATVLIEEFLTGEELSQLCITDGSTIVMLPPAQDHKRVFDGDEGPNTGGMGALSPTPVMTDALSRRIEQEILVPTVHTLAMQGARFSGVLYAGLMIARGMPRVLEFNARFGDPEAQVILPRLKGDLAALLAQCADGRIEPSSGIEIDPRSAVTVVLASAGYPGAFHRGRVITGVEEAARMRDVMVFHAGTAMKDGRLVTNGGRVLSVTALGDTLQAAVERAYEAVAMISFEGMHMRRDIAARALAAGSTAALP